MDVVAVPNNIDAERAVIGAALLDRGACDSALSVVNADDFYLQGHSIIWAACSRLSNDSLSVDLLSVSNSLRESGELDRVGGASYLSDLIDCIPDVANVEHYAGIVRETRIRRLIIASSQKLIEDAQSQQGSSTEALELAHAELQKLTERALSRDLVQISEPSEARIKLLELGEDTSGIKTGFSDLDRMVNGFKPQEFILIGARPSTGKTALALSIARNAALKHEKKIAFFSLEQNNDSMACRMLALEARVNLTKILSSCQVTRDDFRKITMAMERIRECEIYIDDTSAISATQVGAKARRMQAQCGLDLIIIDYAQLMRSPGRGQEEIGRNNSNAIKKMAKDLGVPIILLSQLNRESERRGKSSTPMMSDIRGSGAYEEDADLIIGLRDPLRGDNSRPDSRTIEVHVLKQRQGRTGVVELMFDGAYVRFDSVSYDYESSVDNAGDGW